MHTKCWRLCIFKNVKYSSNVLYHINVKVIIIWVYWSKWIYFSVFISINMGTRKLQITNVADIVLLDCSEDYEDEHRHGLQVCTVVEWGKWNCMQCKACDTVTGDTQPLLFKGSPETKISSEWDNWISLLVWLQLNFHKIPNSNIFSNPQAIMEIWKTPEAQRKTFKLQLLITQSST